MSAAAEPVVPDGEATEPGRKGRKKLIALVAAAVLLAGGEGDADAPAAARAPHRELHKTPPAFLPLENFVVNLADRETERYAQIGIALELDDARFADQLKAYMPAIRNGILMVLAHKTSQELLTRAGKEKLAAEVMRESVRPLGIELDDDTGAVRPAAGGDGEPGATPDRSPVRHCTSRASSSNEPADPLARRSRRAAAGHHRRKPEARAGASARRRGARLRPRQPGTDRPRASNGRYALKVDQLLSSSNLGWLGAPHAG